MKNDRVEFPSRPQACISVLQCKSKGIFKGVHHSFNIKFSAVQMALFG